MLTIVDLGVGNLGSLGSALRFLGVEFRVGSEAGIIEDATAVLLPGVGAFDAAVARMEELELRGPLGQARERGTPFLGICLGMQLLFEGSDEGGLAGLGVLQGRATRLGESGSVKVPHVGFATVRAREGSWLSDALGPVPHFYFTHSFAVRQPPSGSSAGTCDYDGGFVAAIEAWPIVGVQFHPEKSQSSGLRLLKAFIVRAAERE